MRKLKKHSFLTGLIALLSGFMAIHENVFAYQQAPNPRFDDHSPHLSSDGSKITFYSYRTGFAQIYTMNADGTHIQKLTDSQGNNIDPRWSPDGSTILFVSRRDGKNWSIYSMKSDGSEPTNVTASNSLETNPVWSPDGRHILFVSTSGGGNTEVWRMNKDGTNRVQLTDSDKSWKYYPSYSPDGTKIVFLSKIAGKSEIYVMRADGSDEKKISNFSDENITFTLERPGWLNNNKIYMHSNLGLTGRNASFANIYTMNHDGTDLQQMLKHPKGFNNGSFSSKGDKFVFDAGGFGGSEICMINSDGTGFTNLTNSSTRNMFGRWANNGKSIVFRSERDGNQEIYSMDADGNNQVNLTNNVADDTAPAVSDDIQKIVFVSFRSSQFGDLYTMDFNGKNLKKITEDNYFRKLGLIPFYLSFTPDGKRIFMTMRPETGRKRDICVIDIDGKNFQNLTNNEGNILSSFQDVSHDGKSIVFESNVTGNVEVYKMDIEGKNKVRLTDQEGPDWLASWSPDGKKILFSSRRSGGTRSNVFIMNSDGTGVRQITANDDSNFATEISPDGTKIVMYSKGTHNYEIYTIGVDGKNRVQLTGRDK